MDVTVNIRGNAQPLEDELDRVSNMDNPGREPDDSRSPNLPPSDRLIDDLRQALSEQNATSTKEALNIVAAQQRAALNDDITEKYNARRSEAQSRLQSEYERIDEELEERRREGLNNLGDRADDPFYKKILDQQIEDERDRRYKKVGLEFDSEFDEIDNQESRERTQVERDLVDVLKKLTGEIEDEARRDSQGSDPNSYINQLREQRKRLLLERDNAEDEEGALAAQGRLNAVDEQLKNIIGRGQQGRPYFDSLLQGTQGIQGILSGASSGDLSGMIMGTGQSIAGLSGLGLKAAMRTMVVTAIASAVAKGATGIAHSFDDLGELAAYRGTTGGMRGEEGMGYLANNIDRASAYGLLPSDLNLGQEEFYGRASRSIRSRGTTDEWYGETMAQAGLERTLALKEGSLIEGGQYDRYGTNVTDAISRLVTLLTTIEGSGVSEGDFTRVQEKYDIQQQLMASYMGRTDRPNYDWANNTIAAFSSTGVTQDSRMGSDIASFQNMIQNPMNERMRALIYGTVSDIMPETGGRMDLIDRAIRNPENEGKIMQAVVQRITQQFGGTDTTMGYFAFKSLLPDIAPDRLDEYIEQFQSGNFSGGLLSNAAGLQNQDAINQRGSENKEAYANQAGELVSTMTKSIQDLQNYLTTKGVKVFFGTPSVTPNQTKGGN